jgi:hypothetical protein
MVLLKLGLAACAFSIAHGYVLDRNITSLSLSFTDLETNTSPLSSIFLRKETKAIVNGLAWALEGNNDGQSSFLDFTLYVNDKEIQNGTISLSNDPFELPSTIDVGEFIVNESGTVDIKVILDDAIQAPVIVTIKVRAYQSWLVSIPVIIAFGMFLILKLNIVPTMFLAMFIGSWIVEGSLVDGFLAIFARYILDVLTNSKNASM